MKPDSKNNTKRFQELEKMDSALSDALRSFRAAGLTDQANVVARHLFTSTMVPRVGNKGAYNDFLKRHDNSGVHVSVDQNGFSAVNKLFSQSKGDEAIKEFGNVLADVSRQMGGKAFHIGGDEWGLHFAKPEHAHGFARELRERLDKLPLIGGKIKHAAAIGIGHNKDHAEQALLHAKNQLGPTDSITGKRKSNYQLHVQPTVVHSSTHEPHPPGWKPGRGKPEATTPPAPVSHVPHGLTLKNPLAP